MRKTLILTSILGAVFFLVAFTVNATAQKKEEMAFTSDRTDRTLIKDILVGQKELKSMLEEINKKIDDLAKSK